MKKLLSLLLITIVLTLTITSCTALKGAFVKCEVKFDLDGGVAGEGFIESVTVKYGKTVAMSTPTRENFTFEGWYDGDTLYTAETPITKNVTLKAKWTFNNTYTLTFETNGMADVPASHPIIGELPKIPAAPQVEGYVFAGWYFDAEYTTRYFFDYPLSEATTLYAKFYDLSLGEYIVISNVDQLMAIKDAPDAKYLLACDINCKGETLVPINEFSGEIEGNGYKIHNFSINENANNVAFIRTNKGIVKNLTFDDFTYDVSRVADGDKYYGVIAAINKGDIENCHILENDVRIQFHHNRIECYHYIGSIAGKNEGDIIKCSNKSKINVYVNITVEIEHRREVYTLVGGIVGENDGTIKDCFNTGDILVSKKYMTGRGARGFTYIGGIAGRNKETIESSSNHGDISASILGDGTMYYSIGGAVGDNFGKILNTYTVGNITIDNQNNTDEASNNLGGFAGYNTGKIYNCYSVSNINDNSIRLGSVGGFVGCNSLLTGSEALINKCFAMGNIELVKSATNVGYLVGVSTGTVKDSYYADTLAINKVVVTENENGESVETLEAIEVTNTIGEAKAESELLSVDFLENTLYFDRMVWFLVDSKLPELR